MNIRFYNAKILTMNGDMPVFDGELWTEDSRIIYVGDGSNLDEYYKRTGRSAIIWGREIDCKGNLIMPGFKNCHTHSAMTFLRSHADDLPLQDWLNNQVFPYEAKLSPEDICEFTRIAILEYLTGGITGIMEMYLTPESIAKCCLEMGMRVTQVGGVNNFSQSPELIDKWMEELNGKNDLTSFSVGFHAEYTCSLELLKKIADLSHKYKSPVFTHIQETKSETDGCIERYGKTPVALFNDLGMFDYGGAGYHLVWTNDEDRLIMKEKHVSVVTNPGSNSKLASGIAPISEYLNDGIPVAIGTDGPASNNCLDMFREMFLVTALAKLKTNDASAVPATEVLKMATYNGAHVMCTPDADCLAEGKLADIIMIDMNQPNMQPVWNIENNIVYSGSKSDIMMTMIAGVIRYDTFDGFQRFNVGKEVSDIYRDCDSIRKRIFNL